MKTPKDFDYDIWKDDTGHYYIRIKHTGETVRVSSDVVRELWCELYRMKKFREESVIIGKDGSRQARILSLDDDRIDTPESCPAADNAWLISSECVYEDIELEMLEQDFLKTLTEKQLQIYQLAIKERRSISECARICRIAPPTVLDRIALIQKKAKKFFG